MLFTIHYLVQEVNEIMTKVVKKHDKMNYFYTILYFPVLEMTVFQS